MLPSRSNCINNKPIISLPLRVNPVKQFAGINDKIQFFGRSSMTNEFNEESHPGTWQIQSEKIAFDPGEMVVCAACGRVNPPTRLKCFYCAKELEIRAEDEGRIKLVLRKLESWEKGFNLIYLANGHSSEETLAAAAKLLVREADELKPIFDAGSPLPLARLETEREATIVGEGLKQLGVECAIVSDKQLGLERLPVRLRSLR